MASVYSVSAELVLGIVQIIAYDGMLQLETNSSRLNMMYLMVTIPSYSGGPGFEPVNVSRLKFPWSIPQDK
jgi:hypothetical protein